MINREQDIEQLAQQAFSNFEADVPADAWMNIQQSIISVPQSSPSSASSSATGKASGILSKLNSVTVISSSVALVSIVAGIIYFSSPEITSEQNLTVAPVSNETVVAQQEEKISAQENLNISVPEKNTPQQPDNLMSMNADVSEKENSNNEQFSANDYIEPAPKEEPTEITVTQPITPEPAVTLNQETNTQLTTETNKAEEKEVNETSDSETEPAATPEILTESNENASLGSIVNVITPNNDNINDVFVIDGIKIKTLKVSIFNYSNKIIHQWSGLHGFWDGKLDNGSEAEAGTYFYNIFAESIQGKPISKSGSFQLIR